jgi:hypothetical protein
VHILTSYCACGVQQLRIAQSKGTPFWVLLCLKTETELVSEMLCCFEKWVIESPQKRGHASLKNFVKDRVKKKSIKLHSCSVFCFGFCGL